MFQKSEPTESETYMKVSLQFIKMLKLKGKEDQKCNLERALVRVGERQLSQNLFIYCY